MEKALKCAFILIILLALFVGFAHADGGFVPPAWEKSDIFEPEQKALIVHDGEYEELILQVKYISNYSEFGWIIPVPSRPTVSSAEKDIFWRLASITEPRYVSRPKVEIGAAPGLLFVSLLGFFPGLAGNAGVNIVEEGQAGIFDYKIISADNPYGLEDWLKTNNYNLPWSIHPIIPDYVAKKWYFVAARINATRANESNYDGSYYRGYYSRGETDRSLEPISLRFKSKEIVYPLKISSLNKGDSQILIYVISPKKAAISNSDDFALEFAGKAVNLLSFYTICSEGQEGHCANPNGGTCTSSQYYSSKYGCIKSCGDYNAGPCQCYDLACAPGQTCNTANGIQCIGTPTTQSYAPSTGNLSNFASHIGDNFVLSKFRANITRAQMSADLVFENAKDQSDYQMTIYNDGDPFMYVLITFAGAFASFISSLLLFGLFALIFNRFHNKLGLGEEWKISNKRIVAYSFILPIIVLAYGLAYSLLCILSLYDMLGVLTTCFIGLVALYNIVSIVLSFAAFFIFIPINSLTYGWFASGPLFVVALIFLIAFAVLIIFANLLFLHWAALLFQHKIAKYLPEPIRKLVVKE